MPFKKGMSTPGAGRKGYEIEQAQLKKMQRILDRDMEFHSKLQDKIEKGEILTPDEKDMMKITASRISKMSDKLHATKESIEHSGELKLPTPIYDGKSTRRDKV